MTEQKAEEIEALRKTVEKGWRARAFYKGDFWQNDLGPAAAKLQDKADDAKHWKPGTGKTVDDVGLTTAYYSGYRDGADDAILTAVQRMIRDGEDAEKKLKQLQESPK